jgi:hypothetical protein
LFFATRRVNEINLPLSKNIPEGNGVNPVFFDQEG